MFFFRVEGFSQLHSVQSTEERACAVQDAAYLVEECDVTAVSLPPVGPQRKPAEIQIRFRCFPAKR